MDLAQIKQQQGEALRDYMRRFFDKRASVVDVFDKEVIDTFQEGLFDRRMYIDFGRSRPTSISKLKDMIQAWADEEDKAQNKYKTTRDNNQGSSSKPAPSGPNRTFQSNPGNANRKRKPDNTVATMEQASKTPKSDDSQFDKIRKEKCPWHPEGNHTTKQCWSLHRALKDVPEPHRPRKGKGKQDNSDRQCHLRRHTHQALSKATAKGDYVH